MKIFVVITEEYYGGSDKIKIFKTENDAEEYVYKHNDGLDMIILEPEINENCNMAYIVATEDCYGVTENSIFDKHNDAKEYLAELSKRNVKFGYNLDMCILEKEI